MGSGIGTEFIKMFLGIIGYDRSLTAQSDSVLVMAEWLCLWISMIRNLIFVIIIMFNEVDKKCPQIMRGLAERKGI